MDLREQYKIKAVHDPILKRSAWSSDLQRREGVVLQERQTGHRHQQELHTERVTLRGIRVPEAVVDEADGGIRQDQIHHLRDRQIPITHLSRVQPHPNST